MAQKLSGIEAVEKIKEALATAGLPRNSSLAGGEITGWTTHFGNTGFSVRKNGPGVTWHIAVSGKPHFEYLEDEDGRHEPVNPDGISNRIGKLFEGMGLRVHDTRCTGFSTAWDDDVYYEVTTDAPDWLTEPA